MLTLYSFKLTAQTNKIVSLIKDINNSQFCIIHNKRPTFEMHSKAALKLIAIGLPASKKLEEALSDSTKVIMAHLILCHIYFKVATFAGPKTNVINDKDVSNYFLGQKDEEGLIISEVNDNGVYKNYIESKAVEKIMSYWKKKIIKK